MITTCSHQLGPDTHNPGDITRIALKIWECEYESSPTYSPEKRQLQKFSSPKKRGIDEYLATFKIPPYAGFSVHKLFDFSLDEAHFEDYVSPIQIMLSILITSIQGLCSIHDRNGIHRDIKGGNILALITQNEVIGALTDFTFVSPELDELHDIFGSPEYFDPQIFGTIENTLLNQKLRKGLQTKASDIYAFGMTLYIDILYNFLFEKSKNSTNHLEIVALLEKIYYQEINGPFDNKMLQEYGEKYPYRVVYRPDSTSPPHPELLKIYPPLNELKENLIFACLKLNDCLTVSEISGLCMLSFLAYDLMDTDLQKRPNVHQVKNRLDFIYTHLTRDEPLKKSANDSNSPPRTKRKLESASDSNSPPRAKRKLDFETEVVAETSSPSSENSITPTLQEKIVEALSKQIPGRQNQLMLIALSLMVEQNIIEDGMIKSIHIIDNFFYVTKTGFYLRNNNFGISNSDGFSYIFIPTMNHQLDLLQCFTGMPLKATLIISEKDRHKENFVIGYKDANDREYRFSNYTPIDFL